MKTKTARNLGGPASDRNLGAITGNGAKTGVGGTWSTKGQSMGKGGTRKCTVPKHLNPCAGGKKAR